MRIESFCALKPRPFKARAAEFGVFTRAVEALRTSESELIEVTPGRGVRDYVGDGGDWVIWLRTAVTSTSKPSQLELLP